MSRSRHAPIAKRIAFPSRPGSVPDASGPKPAFTPQPTQPVSHTSLLRAHCVSAPRMTGPVAKPYILEIAPYIPGRSTTDDGRKRRQAVVEREPARHQPRRARRLCGFGVTQPRTLPRRQRAPNCARRSPPSTGSIPPGSSTATARTRCFTSPAGAFAGAGDEVIYVHYGFSVYPIATRRVGATPVVASDKDYATDVDAILASVTDKTRIVYVANPNNPTGTYSPKRGDRRVFTPACATTSCSSSTTPTPNIIDGRRRRRRDGSREDPRPTSSSPAPSRRCTASPPSGSAGAMPARTSSRRCTASACPFRSPSPAPPPRSRHSATMPSSRIRPRTTPSGARWFAEEIGKLGNAGLRAVPSQANFVLVLFEGRTDRRDRVQGPHGRGLHRPLAARPGPSLTALRITVGTEDECKGVIAALREMAEQDG